MVKSKYTSLFFLAARHALKNPWGLVGLSIFLITCLLIFSHLWEFIAARNSAANLDPSKLLWFIAFNEWVFISLPDVHEEIAEDLKSGRIAYLITRPISYLGATFAEAMGAFTVNLIFLGVVGFTFTAWNTGGMPFTWDCLFLSLLFGFFSGALILLYYMGIGLSAIWLHEATPFYWIFEKFLFTLGGLMLPLSAYPYWLEKIASFTPFPVMLGQRSALVLDYGFGSALSIAFSLLFWGLFALGILKLTYSYALKQLNVEGG